MARGRLMTHVWRPASASRHHDGDRQVQVHSASTRHECQCAIGDEAALIMPSVSVIDSSTAAAIEQNAGSQAINNSGYNVTSGCNLSLVLI